MAPLDACRASRALEYALKAIFGASIPGESTITGERPWSMSRCLTVIFAAGSNARRLFGACLSPVDPRFRFFSAMVSRCRYGCACGLVSSNEDVIHSKFVFRTQELFCIRLLRQCPLARSVPLLPRHIAQRHC